VNNLEPYAEDLIKQEKNSTIPSIKSYLTWIYSHVSLLGVDAQILEIGAGAGISKKFLQNFEILQTDFLSWEAGAVQGNIDAQGLPFGDSYFSGVFGMDMLHHAPRPYDVISEALRVTKPGGRVLFIEPYVSLFSYPIYKLFHPEKTSITLRALPDRDLVGSSPHDGDQVIAQRVFLSRLGKRQLRKSIREPIEVQHKLISPVSFFTTGGINKPFSVNPRFITSLIRLEKLIPQVVMRIIAARALYVIQKI
jgi:SAM-dependent methyltransferase